MVNFNPNADNTFNLSFLWARFCPAGFCFMSASPLRILVSFVLSTLIYLVYITTFLVSKVIGNKIAPSISHLTVGRD
jgi:hypothetical protein